MRYLANEVSNSVSLHEKEHRYSKVDQLDQHDLVRTQALSGREELINLDWINSAYLHLIAHPQI